MTKDDDVNKLNFIINLNSKETEMSNPYEQQPRTLEEAEKTVEIYEALERLKKTADWNLVIESHLFTNEVLRLHRLKSHPEMDKVETREAIEKELNALSLVQMNLDFIVSIGQSTKTQLLEFREAQLEADNEAMAQGE